jgi:hypothetical protein
VAWQAAGLIAAALVAVAAQAADQRRGPVAPSYSDHAKSVPQTPFRSLKPDERKVLAPVERDWDALPGYQQQRLVQSARRYPSLQPIQKERFDTRIRDWAAMSPEQRRQARETYQGLRKLPPDKQHELRERWLQLHRPPEESSEPDLGQRPASR